MQKVRKAIIPVAGQGTRMFPASHATPKGLFPMVDRNGLAKPLVQLVIEDALAAGVEQVALVTGPGGDEPYRRHFSRPNQALIRSLADSPELTAEAELLTRIQEAVDFVEQPTPEGFGHAIWCARDWVGDEPFLVLLGDHVFLSDCERSCSGQLVRAYEHTGHALSGLTPTPEHLLQYQGTMACEPTEHEDIYRVHLIVEKPSPETARQHLTTPGLPKDTYLAHFGMHLFTPGLFDCLTEMVERDLREKGEIQLTAAQEMLRQREPYFAAVVHGQRYDMGVPLGYIETQLALAQRGPLADQVRELCQQFATRRL
jgi:UTP--glucose-1-phosphate uridylyltransferase